ncbi:hypothetical protein FS837_004004 [Tulasnella sp. UAMH 9824]|nr:hypothetical protein FS837_004004 [Tulasnella sp. UAMH 9824]
MSPHSQPPPPASQTQSLPSFAHTFPDIPRSSSSSTSTTPLSHHQASNNNNAATKKRRFDAIDSSPARPSNDPAHPPAGPPPPPRFNRSSAVPPPPPPHHQVVRRPSRSNSRSSSASSSADPEDDDQDQIQVKEEESENDIPPNPAPASRPHPRLQPPQTFPADSPTYIYPPPTPTGDDPGARKRRRVTISGGSSAHLNQPHLTPSHLNGSGGSHPNVAISPLTPSTVSPVVMGFSVPRTPQGIPHKSSVDQVRSALSMKQQQKALIEARRTNPNASLPLPTPPGTGSSPAHHHPGGYPAPTSESSAGAASTDDRVAILASVPGKKGRTRAVTVTTGTSSIGPQPGVGLGGRGEYVKESTMRSTLPSAHEEPQSPALPPPSRPDPSRMDLDTPVPTPSRPSGSFHPPPPATQSSSDTPAVPTLAPQPTVSLLARRRPGGSALGVNTTGISSTPSSAANTTASIPPSRGDESAGGNMKRGPPLTVRTTALDRPPVSAAREQAGPPPLVNASRPADAPPQQAPAAPPQPATAKSPERIPNIASRAIAIPRHPALTLDPVIRSAPLTVGGRMITSGRPPFPAPSAPENDRVPPVSQAQRLPPTVGRLVPASPTRPALASPTAPKHHSQLFGPSTAQPPIRTPQVPISTTLRTPHVSQFTIPPRPGAAGATTATASNLGQMTADKQSFLNLFGQFYDSLNDAKHLKTWLEGQVQKSDQLITNLERATKELETERKRLREDGPGEEVLRLRARVGELEERLARLEAEPRALRSPDRSQRMDIDLSSGPSPVTSRRPFEFPPTSASHQFPPPNPPHQASQSHQPSTLPPLQLATESGSSGGGRLRSGSMNQHRPPPMPLPPIATLDGNGSTEDLGSAGGKNSRRGSVAGLPPPPPSAGRARRESMSSNHPNLPSPAPVGSFYTSPSSNSISPPQRSSLVPPLVNTGNGAAGGRSPQPPYDTQSPHLPPPPALSRASSKDRPATRNSPLHLPPPSRSSPHQQSQTNNNGLNRGSPLPPPLARQRGSPYIRSTGQQQIVARPSPTPTPTPSPPPRTPRLVDVGSRRDV